MKVASVAEIKTLDSRAVEEFEISTQILMENAGNAAYFVIQKEFGVKGKRFMVICGPGNNGGDGFVVARKLYSNGARVKVLLLIGPDRYQGAARTNIDTLLREKIETIELASVEDVAKGITEADAIVDAILGVGVDRPLEGLYQKAVQLINDSGKVVFALDIPSGINGDNGQEMGVSVKADYTITFGLPKAGNLLYPGYARGGKLYVTHISFPPVLYNSPLIKVEVPVLVPLPERRPDANKMDFGPVLVIAGAASYYWAPFASAYSCLKAGGGYVYLACPASLASAIATGGKEIVFRPQKETATGSIALENKKDLLELASKMKMVILGPGLSLEEETQQLVRELAREIEKPLVIDGDGLTAVAKDVAILSQRKAATFLTPHLGEMERITGIAKEDIEKNRLNILKETARKLNSYIVLKGAHSLIGCPDARVFINTSGTAGGKSAMATAGTGDILNGTIAAMFCLGLNNEDALKAGVFIHGLAGDLAAKEKGADGVTAQNVLDFLPFAVRYYRENLLAIAETYYDTLHVV